MTEAISTISSNMTRWTDAQSGAQSGHDDGCRCVHAADDAADAPITQEPSVAALAEIIAQRA